MEMWLEACVKFTRGSCLRAHFNRRRQILFAAACCRLIWNLIREPGRAAVEAAIGYVDGKVTIKTLRRSRANACRAAELTGEGFARWAAFSAVHVANAASNSVVSCTESHLGTFHAATASVAFEGNYAVGDVDAQVRHTEAWRRQNTIFNTFLPKQVHEGWRNVDTMTIAKAVYQDEDDFPILLDALEEAGADLREHKGTVFYRGNWLVDWLIGNDA